MITLRVSGEVTFYDWDSKDDFFAFMAANHNTVVDLIVESDGQNLDVTEIVENTD